MGKKRRRMGDAAEQVIPVECWIDKLPDELLVAILSCLSIKEAAKTCLMSRRWRDLWRYSSGSLDFFDCDKSTRVPEVANKFTNLVTQVLELHRAPYLHQFKVGFTFIRGSSHKIDRWIEFAIQKEVKLFELNLSAGWRHYEFGYPGTYDFPDTGKLLAATGKLKSLKLVNVNVKEEVLHFFLSNCPLLEQVCVSGSESVEKLEVSGPLPRLKSMEISHLYKLISLVFSCPLPSLKSMEIIGGYRFKSVDIDASNLVSFTYMGPEIVLPFQNFPHFSELTIGAGYCFSFIFDVDKHISYFSKLRKLKLDVHHKVMRATMMRYDCYDNYPILNNLRKLELDITAEFGESLLFFNIFIKASPLLSRFTARIKYCGVFPKEVINCALLAEREAREATRCVHKRLKVVKIIGFTGRRSDYKLALHLLEIGVFLKKLILQPLSDHHSHEFGCEALIRKRRKQLKAKLPPGAKLVML